MILQMQTKRLALAVIAIGGAMMLWALSQRRECMTPAQEVQAARRARNLLYHIEYKYRNCNTLKTMLDPIFVAGTCNVPDKELQSSLPVFASDSLKQNMVGHIKTLCASFPSVRALQQAVEACPNL